MMPFSIPLSSPAAPPYLMTTTLSKNFFMYGNASMRTSLFFMASFTPLHLQLTMSFYLIYRPINYHYLHHSKVHVKRCNGVHVEYSEFMATYSFDRSHVQALALCLPVFRSILIFIFLPVKTFFAFFSLYFFNLSPFLNTLTPP